MKKKWWGILLLGFLVCVLMGLTMQASAENEESEYPVVGAVNQAIKALKQDLHPEYSKKTYAYPKKSAYKKLNSKEKKLYKELYEKITDFEDFSYSAKKYGYNYLDMIYTVWGSLVDDYPEIDNYFTFTENNDKEGMLVSLDSRYYYSWAPEEEQVEKEFLKACQKTFEESADYIIDNMPKGLSTYDKYRYLAYVISCQTDYNYGQLRPSDANPYGALISGQSICQGYASAMCYLCRKANLYCVMAEGSSNGVSHAWNLVKLSTGTYHVDITWSDERGSIGDKFWMSTFMVTQSEIEADSHEVDAGYKATGKLNYNACLSRYTNVLSVGEKYKDPSSGATYRVSSNNLENLQVQYFRPVNKNQTEVTIPKTVKINGNTYKVTGISAKAFLNNKKLKKIVIKTPYLKEVGSSALKGISSKAKIYVPSSKLKSYRTLLKNKGQKSTVKIVKA